MGNPVINTGTYSPPPTTFYTFPHAGKAFRNLKGDLWLSPMPEMSFFRHGVTEKVSLQGPEAFFGMEEKENVSLQDPEGFTGIGEWKRSHSRDKKTFPAWGNEKDFPPQTGRLFRHGRDKKATVHAATS
jgi:hypothetical protein